MSRAARRVEHPQSEVRAEALAFQPIDPLRIPFIVVCRRRHEPTWLGAMAVRADAGEPWRTGESWRSYIDRRKLDSAGGADYIKFGRESFHKVARVVVHAGTDWEFRCPICRRDVPRYNRRVNSDQATDYAWRRVVLAGEQFLDVSDPHRDWSGAFSKTAGASRECANDTHDGCVGIAWALNPDTAAARCGCPCHRSSVAPSRVAVL